MSDIKFPLRIGKAQKRALLDTTGQEIGISLVGDAGELILSKEEAVELAKELIDFIKTV